MKILRLLTCFLVAASAFWAGLSQAGVVVTHPYQGVTCVSRSETWPRSLHMHIVEIDLTAPGIRFKLTPPGGTRDSVRQTTLDFLEREQAQAAINGHFFVPFPSSDTNANLVGLAASDGAVYSTFEPQPVGAGYVDQGYAILPYAAALNIDSANHASIVHRNPAYPDNKHILEPVTLWNAVAGSAQIISNGVKTIPTYSGPPGGLNAIDGYSDSNSWYSVPRARTAIGLSVDGKTLVLFTVDAAGGSGGMTPGEVAGLLIGDYRVYNALNLDGGGSTTMALQDPVTHLGKVITVSGDTPPGRAVGSNLAVFAEPLPEPLSSLTITITDENSIILSWPAAFASWQVQQSSALSPATWENVRSDAQQLGDRLQIVLQPQAATRFYRLSKDASPGGQRLQFP